MTVGLVWAQSRDGVIGVGGKLPWHLPEDLARFKALTTGATVVMGRATWESLPAAVRPLPGRRNVVLSRSPGFAAPGAFVVPSPEDALAAAEGAVWVIGGAQVYAALLPYAGRAVVTEVDVEVAGDTWAPSLDESWALTAADPSEGWHTAAGGLRYRTLDYRRPPVTVGVRS